MKTTQALLSALVLSLLIPGGPTSAEEPDSSVVLVAGQSAANEKAGECADAANKACALIHMPSDKYEALYGASEAGSIPTGPSRGAAQWGPLGPGFLGAFWTGKHFFPPDAEHPKHWLKNYILIGEAVTAEVDYGTSLADGKNSIILDYAKSDNPLARAIRDEIRQVPGQPGVYIGYAYKNLPLIGWVRWLPFALDFNSTGSIPPAQ